MKKRFTLLALATFVSVFSQETPQDFHPKQKPATQQSIPEEKKIKMIGFISFPTPGVGISMRTGVLSLDASVQSTLRYNSLSLSASPIQYFASHRIKPYISLGVGVIGIISETAKIGMTVPLRIGVEGTRVFGDLGAAYVRSYNFEIKRANSERVRLDCRFGIVF